MAKRKQRKLSGNKSQRVKLSNPMESLPVSGVLVNIVIPVHRRFDLLEKCLNAIPEAAQDVSYNVTIFDNGSPREEADAFYNTRKEPNLRIIRNRENFGFPVACNRGADAGFAPLIFFLNDDVILHPTSLQRLVKQMDDPTVGVASMKLIFPEETDLIQDKVRRPAGKVQHVGLETNIRAEFYHIFLGWQPDHPRVMNTHDVYVVTGAALMTRRKIWKQLHGFNPMYGGGCLTGDSYIYTENGIYKIKDLMGKETLEPRDFIVPTMHKTSKAKLAYRNGVTNTLRLDLQQGFTISGTHNHKFVVMNTDGNYDWKELKDISVGDYVALRSNMQMFGKNNLDSDFAYLIGQYIAEGSVEKSRTGFPYRMTITTADEETIKFLQERFGFHSGKNGRSLIHHRKSGKDFIYRFLDIGFDLSLKSGNKFLPQFIMSSDKETIKSVLQGMFDGDGSAIDGNRITYTTSSYELARQVQILLLNFGVLSGIHKRKMKDKIGYIITIRSDTERFMEQIGFRLTRKITIANARKTEPLSYSIPHQRKYVKSLYFMSPIRERNYKTLSYYAHNPKNGVRINTIETLLSERQQFSDTEEYKHLASIINNDFIWLKVVNISDGENEETFDLTVEEDHCYIANGFIAHNTYEDVEYCLAVRKLGYNIVVDPEAVGTHHTGATAEKYGFGFDLIGNRTLFLSRWKNDLDWTEINRL